MVCAVLVLLLFSVGVSGANYQTQIQTIKGLISCTAKAHQNQRVHQTRLDLLKSLSDIQNFDLGRPMNSKNRQVFVTFNVLPGILYGLMCENLVVILSWVIKLRGYSIRYTLI